MQERTVIAGGSNRMLMKPTIATILAVASTSNKEKNQDACAVVKNEEAGLTAVIVADGIGSHFAADQGSHVVTESAVSTLAELGQDSHVGLEDVFREAHTRLKKHVVEHAEDIPADVDWANAFGTTLLCAVETRRHLLLGYVGNGALVHIRGNFNSFPESQLLPWSAINYLNPHSFSRNGKNVLYKLLSAKPVFWTQPNSFISEWMVRKVLPLAAPCWSGWTDRTGPQILISALKTPLKEAQFASKPVCFNGLRCRSLVPCAN